MVDIQYEVYSQTVRQMPENYMLARKVRGVWVVDCDGAVTVDTVLHVSMAIHCDGEKFASGESVAVAITASMARYTIEIK